MVGKIWDSGVYPQNATIKKALQQLKDIGFLEYSVDKENGDYILNILKRNPKL